MSKKSIKLVGLASALAALPGAAALVATPANAKAVTSDTANALKENAQAGLQPNVFMPVGENLLGLIVTKSADGTVLADHYSHSSHSSHSSHYSGR